MVNIFDRASVRGIIKNCDIGVNNNLMFIVLQCGGSVVLYLLEMLDVKRLVNLSRSDIVSIT